MTNKRNNVQFNPVDAMHVYTFQRFLFVYIDNIDNRDIYTQ